MGACHAKGATLPVAMTTVSLGEGQVVRVDTTNTMPALAPESCAYLRITGVNHCNRVERDVEVSRSFSLEAVEYCSVDDSTNVFDARQAIVPPYHLQ